MITKNRERNCSIHGHKFEARYDRRLPENLNSIRGDYDEELLEALKQDIYLFDICIYCGKKIERDE